jgi:hypothetical protein
MLRAPPTATASPMRIAAPARAELDLPTQIVNDDSALTYHCRCSVAWRLGIALYVKAAGIPWKLATSEVGTAYIGISYALRPATGEDGQGRAQFVTCCSQVFDADGLGLEFIAYSPHEVEVEGGVNPYLSRDEMRPRDRAKFGAVSAPPRRSESDSCRCT